LDDPEIAGVVVNSRDVSEQHRALQYNAVLSRLGLQLSSALSAEDAAHVIGDSAAELFGWDACSLDLYSAQEDKILPILNIDTVDGCKVEIPASEIEDSPSPRSRRILSEGAELILREEPLAMTPDAVPFGDKARPSASLMFVPIRNGPRALGILSIQSYKLNAYDQRALDGLQTLADYCGGALERIRVEQALRESERRFRQLFEDSPDAVFVEDIEGRVLDANAAAARLQGMTRQELIGKNLAELVPPDEAAAAMSLYKKLVAGEMQQIEGKTLTAQGREVPVEVRTSRIDFSGQPALLLHVRDISERKRAEEALVSSEIRFHSVWDNSVDAMRLTDENGIIVAVNAAYCKLAEMKREDLEGQPFTIAFAESEHPNQLLDLYKERFATRTMTRQVQRKMTYRSGKTVEIEGSNTFVESRGQRTLLLGLFRDTSERKRLEEQLRQSQKMDAIGQLAGGVAHDFNNILTVIQGHASLLKSVVPNNTSAEQISQAAERATGLTRQLLTFSRRQMMQPKALDLDSVVSNLTKMLGRILGEDISLQFNYSPNQPVVHADVGMIEQILLNLAVNSRDAMPNGGQLAIRVSVLHLSGDKLAEHPEGREGEFVRLSVRDTGTGIDAATLPHIFEPFFTTKEVGKGTGLGLATVYGIIKQHLGWVEVESAVGKGTTFHVFLPCVREAAASAEKTSATPGPRGGNETILVVEDELPVRELVCKILKGAGYQVLEAATGVEALKVWDAHKDQIDLLLTDIVMPDGMSGRDLAEKVQAAKPSLKAIFTSGYSADMIGKDFVIQEGVNFLQKPYLPQKMIGLIRNCLDGR
jgi:PAS domain S-box-containing protein